jgi:hypothetical protein
MKRAEDRHFIAFPILCRVMSGMTYNLYVKLVAEKQIVFGFITTVRD